MKNIFLFFLVMLSVTAISAQIRLEKIWESDSITLKGPESATYDAVSNSIYVSSMNSGSILRLGIDGKFIQQDWIAGLKSNKGIGFYKGLLYVAETTTVAVIDIEKAKLIKRIPIDSAVMLNDLAVDLKGVVYVSDTRRGTVHRIEQDVPALYLDNMPGANGLLCDHTDLYLVTTNHFYKIDHHKKTTKIADGFVNGLDGIVKLNKSQFIVSNYTGILYEVKTNGEKDILLDTRPNKIMANDISYNPKTNMLFVPNFSTNRVVAYRVKKG